MTGTIDRKAARVVRTIRPAPLLASVVTLALGVTGCSNLFMPDQEALWKSSPHERHAIGIQSAEARLDVELPPPGAGLSDGQHADLAGFLDRFLAESTGALRVSAPAHGGSALREVQAAAATAGVRSSEIRVERHQGGGAIRLAYARRELAPPQCSDWSEDLGNNPARVPSPDFGCATQRNLALNVANPRDLVKPQRESARSSERRSIDWSKYVGVPEGTPGASAADTKAKANQPKSPGAPMAPTN